MLPTTPVALAFANTLVPRTPALRTPEPAQVLQHLAALTQLLTPWDLQALGIWPDASARHGMRQVHARDGCGLPDGRIVVSESPAGSHRALLWCVGDSARCQVWVDGQSLDTPRQADGQPLTLLPGHWAGEDFFCLETLVGESTAAPSSSAPPFRAGPQRGLWVGQVSTGLHWQLHPAADEHWPSPWARWVAGTGLRVWADSRSEGAPPARELALETQRRP
jgi:hypothetical protein